MPGVPYCLHCHVTCACIRKALTQDARLHILTTLGKTHIDVVLNRANTLIDSYWLLSCTSQYFTQSTVLPTSKQTTVTYSSEWKTCHEPQIQVRVHMACPGSLQLGAQTPTPSITHQQKSRRDHKRDSPHPCDGATSSPQYRAPPTRIRSSSLSLRCHEVVRRLRMTASTIIDVWSRLSS